MKAIKPITSCPVTLGTYGKILLAPKVAGLLNGLLYGSPTNEWAAIGKGVRSEDGRLVLVEDLWIPPQDRQHSYVAIVGDIDQEESDVCVFHSHHSMGAFFSGTDREELNPNFPSSVVIANLSEDAESHAVNLGFDYEAVMTVKLPCGKLGQLQAMVDVPDVQVSFDIPEWIAGHRGECHETEVVEETDRFKILSSKCQEARDSLPVSQINKVRLWGSDPSLLSSLPPPVVLAPRGRKNFISYTKEKAPDYPIWTPNKSSAPIEMVDMDYQDLFETDDLMTILQFKGPKDLLEYMMDYPSGAQQVFDDLRILFGLEGYDKEIPLN